jgi:hypothetical protein
MVRWGYVALDQAGKKQPDWVLRATRHGLAAREVWGPLFGTIEDRWRERFGPKAVSDLRASLVKLIEQFDEDLPDCMPILGYGLANAAVRYRPKTSGMDFGNAPLPALLAKPLIRFAVEFERQSPVSLAICANVLRIAPPSGVRIKDLPSLGGISKEAVAMAVGWLERHGFGSVRPETPGSRHKALFLLDQGLAAQAGYLKLTSEIESAWRSQFGADTVDTLTASSASIASDRDRLFDGFKPHPGNWRASVPCPAVLPKFTMVLHRGGYPDGS